jgi:hypothetical protein
MIRTFFEKRRIKRIFGRIVDPKSVDALLQEPVELEPPKQGRVEFVVAFIRETNVSEASQRMGRVTELATTHGAMICNVVAGLVIMAFRPDASASGESDKRSSLVYALRAPDIKVVHGAADGHFGLFGGDRYSSYTFLVPRFDAVLGTLDRLEFGQTEEFRQ